MAADQPSHGFSTRAIHAGQDADPATGATVVPIYATSTFTQEAPGKHKGYEYARSGNPTRTALETCLAALEGSERALAFASGLAATTAVLSTLRPGDEVAAAADLYGGTFRLLERVFKPWGLVPRYTEDASPAGFAAILSPATKLVWIETPTNPLLQIVDIAAIAALAHEPGRPAGGGQHVCLALSAAADRARSRPGGPQHDQVPGGTFRRHRRSGRRLARACSSRSRFTRMPPVPSPARLIRGSCSAASRRWPCGWSAIARTPDCSRRGWRSSRRCARVYYPGLADHPNHDVARRQMRDFGGHDQRATEGGCRGRPAAALTRTRLFSLAESLGGVESLIGHPATMTHASIPAEIRAARGVDDGLVRLSRGDRRRRGSARRSGAGHRVDR